ncbi:Fur family transcriptional regulator [Venenivibrio stagnispumantis]|uniref:Ferric uptake regulation protein n=1 Tax=Venenivibrio stagnispumantis TaxID=407998 RepID=A0AA46ADG4_9AQUI|nr:Fur family transcriptional regulator [Venenivibrio stagnispumantis]MCW4572928.1 transcriptional repressor [Venenivibrio stagnispumantis]SMP04699.1 Fur family transcriptional regulator, ferric uptake regulator [Venenivibrio stagnispumantis]
MKLKQIEESLSSKGFKITKQRKQILDFILKTKGHFEIEDIVYKMKKKNKNVSRATIYRTIGLLKELGFVEEVIKYDNKTIYEIAGKGHHDHLICIKCGKIIEFEDKNIEKLQNKICKKYNFKPIYHRLEIFGICEECQKGEK